MIRRLKRRNAIWILICYAVAVLMVTLGIRTFNDEIHVALNPFHEYVTIIRIARDGYAKRGLIGAWKRLGIYRHAVFTPLLNVLLFIPLGYLAPHAFVSIRKYRKVLAIGLVFSLLIETIQYITHLGWFDISDLMHNTLGTGIGYWIFQRWLMTEKKGMTKT